MKPDLERTHRNIVEVNGIQSGTAYRRPAEFTAHLRTWMIWPHRSDLYGGRLVPMQREFAAIVAAIADFEPVCIVAHPDHVDTARRNLDSRARIVSVPVDDFWMRDCGPTFVIGAGGELTGVSWRFNAWGGKHSPWALDDQLANRILGLERATARQSWLTCEGGSLTCDGEGTLIVTETSILNPNRNPGVNKPLAEAELKDMLGVEKVVWLPGDPMDKDLYDLPPEELKGIPTVCGSLREALGALAADHEFLLAGDVFSIDQIESYIELKWSEVYRFEHTPHPVEFEMYYSV